MANNRPGSIPSLPASAGSIISRGDFLSGKIQAWACPGQDLAPFDDDNNYVPPNDWLPAGSLLRPPQMVWLSIRTPDQFNPTFNFTQANTPLLMIQMLPDVERWSATQCVAQGNNYLTLTDSLTYKYWSDGSYLLTYIPDEANYTSDDPCNGTEIGVDPADYTTQTGSQGATDFGWYSDSVPNDYKAIYDNFTNNVFPEVKTAIETLRKGRTWCTITNFANPLIAPPVDQTANFFGPNFLHIFIGGPYYDPSSGESSIDSAILTVQAAYLQWTGYKVFVYSITSTWSQLRPFPTIPFVETPPAIATYQVKQSSIPPTNITQPTTTYSIFTTAASPGWAQLGSFLAYRDTPDSADDPGDFGTPPGLTNNQFYLQQKAAYLTLSGQPNNAAQDTGTAEDAQILNGHIALADIFTTRDNILEYKGDATSFSSNDIISIIANYFNFDYETGYDL